MGLDEVQDSCSDYKLSGSPYNSSDLDRVTVLLINLLQDWKRFCVSVLGGFLWKLQFRAERSVNLQSLQSSDTFGKTTSKKARLKPRHPALHQAAQRLQILVTVRAK